MANKLKLAVVTTLTVCCTLLLATSPHAAAPQKGESAETAKAAPSGSTVAVPTPYPPRPGSKLSAEQETRGWELVKNNCLACHTADLMSQQRLTEKQWAASCAKMRKWGALLHESQDPEIVAYLADHFPADLPTAVIPLVKYTETISVLQPVSDGVFAKGDPHKGKELYIANCASCHAENGRGGTGTNLVDRTSLWRAEEFAKVVKDGRGQMPPYADMFSDEQIAGMIAYLRTVPPSDIATSQTQPRKAPAGN